MGKEYLSVPVAAAMAGLKPRAFYDLIKEKQVPYEAEKVGRIWRYKIPARPFLAWLKREWDKFEGKMNFFKTSHRQLEGYING